MKQIILIVNTKFQINFLVARQLWIFLPYLFLVIWVIPDNFSVLQKIGFIVYSIFLFVILSVLVRTDQETHFKTFEENNSQGVFFWFLISSFVFLLITRLMPFIRFGEAPLGYDTGFYVWEFARSGFSMGTNRTFYLILAPLYQLGMSPTAIIHFINILAQVLIAGSIYFLLRSMKIASRSKLAVIGVFLFSVSIIQFDAYWWMLPRQMFATGFLFITIALLSRYPFLAILTASAGIFIHVLPFAMFAVALVVYLIIQLVWSYWQKKVFDRKTIVSLAVAVGISLIILLFKRDEMISLVNYAISHNGLATSLPFWLVSAAKGAFINISTFYYFNLIILPFVFFGLMRPLIWGKETLKQQPILIALLYIIFIGLFLLSLFPVLRQNRFIILLDFFFIIFAVPPILLLVSEFLKSKIGKVLLIIFVIIFGIRIGVIVWAQQPQLYNNELREIKALATLTEPKAKIMTTNSLYTPWVKGYSERLVFGPGLEQELVDWDFQTWMNFWNGGSDEQRLQLLTEAPGPLYIFIGKNENKSMSYQQFIRNDSHFKQLSSQVWKFVP